MKEGDKIVVPTFLKWAGGKQHLLSQFHNKFPSEIKHYVEPFIGGGAVLFYVLKYKNPISIRAYDNNPELVNVYKQVRNNVKLLIKELKILENGHNNSEDPKSYYYKKRTEFNTISKNKVKKAALFIYLNKSCFNGLFRVNSKGEFNVPFNGDKEIKLFDRSNLMEASNLLKNVQFEAKDFRSINFRKNDCVYFDPPYWSESESKGFTSYTNPVFNKQSQQELAKIFKSLYNKGCKVILSNSNTKLIREMYSHPFFNLYDNIEARRMINCNGDGRHKINEVLITANF